jgi:transposase IS66 family protein/transposase IS66-like protein
MRKPSRRTSLSQRTWATRHSATQHDGDGSVAAAFGYEPADRSRGVEQRNRPTGCGTKFGFYGRWALSRWQALCRYRDDGRTEIDNNAAQRSLRAIALGRKNHLFVGADTGGERALGIYSPIASAKLNGIDPEAYLRYVRERIAEHPINRITELLSWNVFGHRARCSRT